MAARFRLSRLAQADLRRILAASETRWGIEGRRRYAAILAAAMRKVAADPEGPVTRERADLSPHVRSMHLRYARGLEPAATVKAPVHILYYRAVRPDVIEIVRILHERMEPGRHIGGNRV